MKSRQNSVSSSDSGKKVELTGLAKDKRRALISKLPTTFIKGNDLAKKKQSKRGQTTFVKPAPHKSFSFN